jgi:hypothetical protein
MFGQYRLNDRVVQCLQARQGTGFVAFHEAAIAHHVGGHDRSDPSLDNVHSASIDRWDFGQR